MGSVIIVLLQVKTPRLRELKSNVQLAQLAGGRAGATPGPLLTGVGVLSISVLVLCTLIP